jgi:TorA maturation chaperone TorD
LEDERGLPMGIAGELDAQAARVYHFLSRAFLQPPDLAYLKSAADWCAELLIQQEILPGELVAALEAMQAALAPEVTEERVQEFQQEFVRLFRGLSPRYSPPPPYESVHREGRLWGASTVAVRKLYRQWGLEPAEAFRGEPPDHLGLELQFMGFLCEQAHTAEDEGRRREALQTQQAFLEEHLSWIEAFEERTLTYDPHRFYEGLLRLTSAWLTLHRRNFRIRRERR